MTEGIHGCEMVMWSHTGPKDPKDPRHPKDSKRFVISSSLKQSVTSEGRVPCVEAIFKTSWRWTEQEEHSSDLSVDNEITRIGMVMGSLNVSDVDDRTDVDWFKILIEQLIRFRYFSRFWTSSALRSCALTKVMGRISESPGFHMLVCRSIRACFASFLQSLRPKQLRSFHRAMMFLCLASSFMAWQCVIKPMQCRF